MQVYFLPLILKWCLSFVSLIASYSRKTSLGEHSTASRKALIQSAWKQVTWDDLMEPNNYYCTTINYSTLVFRQNSKLKQYCEKIFGENYGLATFLSFKLLIYQSQKISNYKVLWLYFIVYLSLNYGNSREESEYNYFLWWECKKQSNFRWYLF